jgi:putative transcriptional regulator
MPRRGETQAKPAFAVRLKALREAAGLSQAQLAERAGLHLGAIFKLEQGRREPTWATVQTLAKALGVTCLAFADEPPAAAPARKAKRGGKQA